LRSYSTFTGRKLSWWPVDSVAHCWQRRWDWWSKSINTGVMYDGALNCQVTVRYGVVYCSHWSTPVSCIYKIIQFIELGGIS